MRFRLSDLLSRGEVDVTPQIWARRASWLSFACVLPSFCWRVAMLAGLDTGFAEADMFRSSAGLTAYVVGLEVIEIGAGVLCLGLAQSWGERVPSWVPRWGGRTIHRPVPTALGCLGAAALYAFVGGMVVKFGGSWLGLSDNWTPIDGMNTWQTVILLAAYIPLLAWPLALTVSLVGYWRRRSPRHTRMREPVAA